MFTTSFAGGVMKAGTAFALLSTVLVTGCFGDESTEFPEGLEPLEENTAEPPELNEDGTYPETFNAVYGESRWYWGHLKGYFNAPAEDVWAAIMDPEVLADRRTADRLTFETDIELDEQYDFGFVLHYLVEEFIDVEWDEEYRFGILDDGSGETPFVVVGRWQKIWGTTFIDLVEGSIRIEAIDENTTQFEVVEHLDAVGADTATVRQWFEDAFASIAARVHGEPLPTY